jgi:hypothetical protein
MQAGVEGSEGQGPEGAEDRREALAELIAVQGAVREHPEDRVVEHSRLSRHIANIYRLDMSCPREEGIVRMVVRESGRRQARAAHGHDKVTEKWS